MDAFVMLQELLEQEQLTDFSGKRTEYSFGLSDERCGGKLSCISQCQNDGGIQADIRKDIGIDEL